MKPQSVISLGAITGQADNVMLSAMQSVPVHSNTLECMCSCVADAIFLSDDVSSHRETCLLPEFRTKSELQKADICVLEWFGKYYVLKRYVYFGAPMCLSHLTSYHDEGCIEAVASDYNSTRACDILA